MRQKILCFWVWIAVALAPGYAEAQQSMRDSIKSTAKQLTEFRDQLIRLDAKMTNATECEIYASDYCDLCELINVYYTEHQSFILTQEKKLFPIWSNVRNMRDSLGGKIQQLKLESQKTERQKALTLEFGQIKAQYEQMLLQLQQLPDMKRNPSADTLSLLKKKDAEIYPSFAATKEQQEVKELIWQNPQLDSLRDYIETAHKAINETKDIEKIRWGDIIFKAILIVTILIFLVNLIVSKKKLKTQINGQKNKYTPSI